MCPRSDPAAGDHFSPMDNIDEICVDERTSTHRSIHKAQQIHLVFIFWTLFFQTDAHSDFDRRFLYIGPSLYCFPARHPRGLVKLSRYWRRLYTSALCVCSVTFPCTSRTYLKSIFFLDLISFVGTAYIKSWASNALLPFLISSPNLDCPLVPSSFQIFPRSFP